MRSILGKVFELKKKCSRYTHLTIPPINHGLLLDLFMMVSLIRGFGVIATSIPSCLLNPGLCSGNQKHSPMHNTELVVFLLANHSVASGSQPHRLWELGPYLTGTIPFPSIGQQHTGQSSVTKPSRVEAMSCCT